MNRAELAKVRAEVGDPKELALRNLAWLGRNLMGLILLAEDLEGPVSMSKVADAAKADADAAKAQLRELTDAISKAAAVQAEQVAKFDSERRERERILAALEAELKLGTASKEAKRLAEVRTQLAEATAELAAKQDRIAQLRATMAALAAEG